MVIGQAVGESRSYKITLGAIIFPVAVTIVVLVFLGLWNDPRVQFGTGVVTSLLIIVALLGTHKQRRRDRIYNRNQESSSE